LGVSIGKADPGENFVARRKGRTKCRIRGDTGMESDSTIEISFSPFLPARECTCVRVTYHDSSIITS